MRILQLLPTISFGDAVGNNALAMQRLLISWGYDTAIYAENIDPRLKKGLALPVSSMPSLGKKDVLLYHLSTGTDLNYKLADYAAKKVVIYHNITPPGYALWHFHL